MQDKDIINFWKWFTKNESKLQSDNYDSLKLDKLNKTISKWDLSWEIGPGKEKKNSLTFSPKGDKELLLVTKEIVNNAPSFENWEFYSSKQPKENWHLLELINHNINIDASEWEYVLLKYKDGKIEILIKADNLSNFEQNKKNLIADIVLTNLLGEKVMMEKIDFLEVVEEFDIENGITEISYLPEHLQ